METYFLAEEAQLPGAWATSPALLDYYRSHAGPSSAPGAGPGAAAFAGAGAGSQARGVSGRRSQPQMGTVTSLGDLLEEVEEEEGTTEGGEEGVEEGKAEVAAEARPQSGMGSGGRVQKSEGAEASQRWSSRPALAASKPQAASSLPGARRGWSGQAGGIGGSSAPGQAGSYRSVHGTPHHSSSSNALMLGTLTSLATIAGWRSSGDFDRMSCPAAAASSTTIIATTTTAAPIATAASHVGHDPAATAAATARARSRALLLQRRAAQAEQGQGQGIGSGALAAGSMGSSSSSITANAQATLFLQHIMTSGSWRIPSGFSTYPVHPPPDSAGSQQGTGGPNPYRYPQSRPPSSASAAASTPGNAYAAGYAAAGEAGPGSLGQPLAIPAMPVPVPVAMAALPAPMAMQAPARSVSGLSASSTDASSCLTSGAHASGPALAQHPTGSVQRRPFAAPGAAMTTATASAQAAARPSGATRCLSMGHGAAHHAHPHASSSHASTAGGSMLSSRSNTTSQLDFCTLGVAASGSSLGSKKQAAFLQSLRAYSLAVASSSGGISSNSGAHASGARKQGAGASHGDPHDSLAFGQSPDHAGGISSSSSREPSREPLPKAAESSHGANAGAGSRQQQQGLVSFDEWAPPESAQRNVVAQAARGSELQRSHSHASSSALATAARLTRSMAHARSQAQAQARRDAGGQGALLSTASGALFSTNASVSLTAAALLAEGEAHGPCDLDMDQPSAAAQARRRGQ